RNYYQKYIIPYLEKLSPYQRASICYSGDFYHLRQFNSGFIRSLLEEMAERITTTESVPDVATKMHTVDENVINFVHHIFFAELEGRGKDYEKINKACPGLVDNIYVTCLHVVDVLMKYKTFFNTFFMNDIMPNNSYRLKNMRRRTVVLSDTDSTCFTLDEWLKWYGNGEFFISPKTVAIGGAISYITTQSIVHLLRVFSCNMGVDPDLIDKLGMKNEFLWLVHVPAEVSKHYFAYTVMQETNVLGVPEIEIKGVHLKNSAVSKVMIDDGKALMKSILERVANNEKIKLTDVVKHIIQLEEDIIASVYKGESVFLKKSKIKTKDAYIEEPNRSPYGRHLFWNEVFGLKYGDFPSPPYDVVKIPTIVTTKTALKAWVDSIEDSELKLRLEVWLNKNQKSNLPTIYLNDSYVLGSGIPKEIISIIDIQRIVLDVTGQHRVILETLGVLLYKDRMIKDQFKLIDQ
ncbi:family B DNA polymerase, partial [Flavobacterium sp.]|uniref:family B DNA polymerase n=1 Tax=Flavobacterium sp. TaxID=239 RepID=UPI0037BE36FD